MEKLKDKIENLTEEEKAKIVEDANLEEDSSEGNTIVSSIADDPEAKEMHDKITPKQLYDNQIAASFRSNYKLGQLLPNLSKKNLVKLMMFLCRLPEKDGFIKFGGTKKQQMEAEQAFIESQIAFNAKTYILAVDAKARAMLDKQKTETSTTENEGEPNGEEKA